MKSILLLLSAALLTACSTSSDPGSSPTAAATGGGVRPYPLTTCIVTDNDLHSMGGAVRKVYGNQEVKFCCRPCVRAYEKSPEKYLAKING